MTAEISRAAGPVAARDQAPPPGVPGEGRPGGGTQLRIGSLCSGYEGLGMAVQMVLGGELAWVADNDPGASAVLAHRFPSVKNLGDITETDWAAVEPVDIVTAGFPCQDVSCAGGRTGLREGNRTGVWAYVALAIDALRPRLVLLENVGGLLSASADSDMEPCPWCLGDSGSEPALRALGAVLGDLAEIGFDADWCCIRASDTGAPHRRERVFVVAWPAADAGMPDAEGLTRRSGKVQEAQAGQIRGTGDRGLRLAENANGPIGGERRLPAPGQAESGRTRADAGRPGGVRAADGWPPCPYLADCDAIEESCPDEPGRWHIRAGYCTTEPHALCAEDAADAERDGQPGRSPGSAGEADEPRQGPRAETAGRGPAPAECEPWSIGPGESRCPSCGCPDYAHDADGFCAGPCGGNCAEPELGRPDGPWNSFEDDADPADVRAYALAHSKGDPERLGHGDDVLPGRGADGRGPTAGRGAPADANRRRGDRLHERVEPGHLATDIERGRKGIRAGVASGQTQWGAYEPAIRRWEAVLGRPAPRPTEPGRTGQRLSPRFVEWLMGLPEGWVTDVPGLSRNAQLKLLGNGVVPAQAALALSLLLEHLREVAA